MKDKFNKNQKVGEIVAEFPKASEIFMKYKLDFCCGGNRTLDNAVIEDKVDSDVALIIDELNESYEKYNSISSKEDIDWRKENNIKIIDHILNTHHAYMRNQLPITENLISKILKAHYSKNGDMLSKVHKLFNQFKVEIEEHLIKEEEVLFPLIKIFEENKDKEVLNNILNILSETEHEHDVAGNIIKEIRKVTNNYELPENACKSFELAYENLKDIEKDLFNHVHLENNILFEKIKG
ncbi:iron-sulfur cluster repair protein ScdA [Gottschalkia purinilytica]|uniref:Iron-sulfur cluster repair protein ScdA n=1 Tax=Gottschalkia purinilytica TaxID=1503 RepID=A0A0L0WCR9_GOTPU|nr:iron-sulfur cluster repair di-iron protein [Gottschalkia purinilytica]KNF09210.1 iron-sulfur cluster repair protein ScdA [Gottschalkia purinilytica]